MGFCTNRIFDRLKSQSIPWILINTYWLCRRETVCFVDPRLSTFREAKPRETSTVEVQQTYSFLRTQSISILFYTKIKKMTNSSNYIWQYIICILFLKLMTLNLICNTTMSILSRGRVFTWWRMWFFRCYTSSSKCPVTKLYFYPVLQWFY